MKLRAKIIVIFISSIIMSVFLFIFINWYMMSNGWWSGIHTSDMDFAANSAASQIQKLDSLDELKVKVILEDWKNEYNGMELELLSKQLNLIYTTAPSQQIRTMEELIQSLSTHEEFSHKSWVAVREIGLKNGENGYLVVIVPAKYFTALYFSVNGSKGAGIFGKMFIIGLGITLIISSTFAYIFSISISKRFDVLYKEISRFKLGNMDLKIDDSSQDELGYLAAAFKKMADRLKNQVDDEKAYYEERKKLVSNISHDIRTPLTSIIGYSESLENGIYENEEDKKRYIAIIRKKALYMEKLFRELIDFSRLESGHIIIKRKKVDAAEISREILIEYLPILQEEGLEINVDIPEFPVWANIDKDEISRAIRNLLDNAIKYGKAGVTIGFSLIDTQDNLHIEIKDNGQGIEGKNLHLIFNRFFREDKSRNAKEGGMGLGLAIADEIVKLHNGNIRVKSSPGKGSIFTIILPKD